MNAPCSKLSKILAKIVFHPLCCWKFWCSWKPSLVYTLIVQQHLSELLFQAFSSFDLHIFIHLYVTWSLQMIKKTRDPIWNEEFQFMVEEPPLHDKIRVEVMSKRTGFRFQSKVLLATFLLILPSNLFPHLLYNAEI